MMYPFEIDLIKFHKDVYKLSRTVGKTVGGSYYIHISAMPMFPPYMKQVLFFMISFYVKSKYNVIKINMRAFSVSFLSYTEFDSQEFPELLQSVTVKDGKRSERLYGHINVIILHRKELLLPFKVPMFEQLTSDCEEVGAYEDTKRIGQKEFWFNRLHDLGYYVKDHYLLPNPLPKELQL